jgi:hypothetical protein
MPLAAPGCFVAGNLRKAKSVAIPERRIADEQGRPIAVAKYPLAGRLITCAIVSRRKRKGALTGAPCGKVHWKRSGEKKPRRLRG